MKVLQLLPTLAMGDAIGNDVRALEKVIRGMGYQTGIYAEVIDGRLPEGTAQQVEKMPRLSGEDVILYHMSTGSELNFSLEKYPCRKLMVFHNITPPRFFKGYNDAAMESAEYGMRGLCHLADKVDGCMADSAYNGDILRELNYRSPITVRPILIPFADYAKEPDASVMEHYKDDGYTNFIFVGRVAPNKKQEDVIRAFYCYKKYCNPKSRLFIVGSYNGMERYYHRLRRYVGALELDNVVFTGHIPFAQILAYYHLADLFLCMSDHEGFCVPLVEAMYFNLPILAYDSSAISDTLGGSGILLPTNDPMEAALAADRVLRDSELRREVIAEQHRRQQEFAYPEIRKVFEGQLQHFIDTVPPVSKNGSKRRHGSAGSPAEKQRINKGFIRKVLPVRHIGRRFQHHAENRFRHSVVRGKHPRRCRNGTAGSHSTPAKGRDGGRDTYHLCQGVHRRLERELLRRRDGSGRGYYSPPFPGAPA